MLAYSKFYPFIIKIMRIFFIFALFCCIQAAWADFLTIQTIENSLEHCYPQILNASIEQEINQAKVDKNRSPFDSQLNANTNQRQGSSYDTQYERVAFEKRIYGSPVSVYTGYDISSGYAPQYEGAQITSTQGREFLGLKFNLLSGFAIDKERLDLYNSILEKDKAGYQLDLVRLTVKTDAMRAYLNWLIAGAELRSYERLVKVAERRQHALKKRLEEGDVAKITVTENYNNLLKRRIKLISAQDYFNQTTQNLSLYYRNNGCKMLLPNETLLPEKTPKVTQKNLLNTTEEMNASVQKRPEFRIINTQIAQLNNEKKYAETNLLPKLNVLLQYNNNNSDTATTPDFIINQNEYLAKLEFSFPLEQNLGKSMNTEAIKKLQKLQNDRQLLLDQLYSRINTLSFRIKNTRTQRELAQNEWSLAQELFIAENDRFDEGDSNFFMLNLREENVTNAYIGMLNAISQNYQALIEYNFLNGQNMDLIKTYGSVLH